MSIHTHLRPAVWRRTAAAFAAALCLGASSVASAALFEDDEARRAILELRQQRANADAPGRGAAPGNQPAAPQPAGLAEPDRDAARRNSPPEWPERAAAARPGRRAAAPEGHRPGRGRAAAQGRTLQGFGGRPRVHRRPDRVRANSRPRWRSSARASSRRRRPRSPSSSSAIRKAASGPRRCSGWAMRSTPTATTAAPSRISAPC